MSSLNLVPANQQIVEDFWQSLCSLPRNQNPTFYNEGSKDEDANNIRQSNNGFFYLSVNHEGSNVRNCEVSSNQSVVIPSLSVLASEKERPGSTDNQLNAFATVDQQYIEPNSQYVIIDKKPVTNLNNFRVRTNVFEVKYPSLNLFNAVPGDSHAVADGTYLVLQDFAKGEMVEISFGGTIHVPDDQDSLEYRTYYEDLTYNLKIV
jgi:hypothetical protein